MRPEGIATVLRVYAHGFPFVQTSNGPFVRVLASFNSGTVLKMQQRYKFPGPGDAACEFVALMFDQVSPCAITFFDIPSSRSALWSYGSFTSFSRFFDARAVI